MSKLDDINIDMYGKSVGQLKDAPYAKQQIKDLMLELIGDNEKLRKGFHINNTNDSRAFWSNNLKDELREKVQDL